MFQMVQERVSLTHPDVDDKETKTDDVENNISHLLSLCFSWTAACSLDCSVCFENGLH